MFSALIHGFFAGGGLIMAIGAQNAFVLARGIRRHHHLLVAAICILCDVVLISAGVAGVGTAVAAHPLAGQLAALGGAAFLGCYGAQSLKSALNPGALEARDTITITRLSTVSQTLAVTLLNPHVYLDTVLLLGSLSGQFPGRGRWFFAAGAMVASTVWFLSLALCGRLLAPVFRRPDAWRILDLLICATMWTIAASLVLRVI